MKHPPKPNNFRFVFLWERTQSRGRSSFAASYRHYFLFLCKQNRIHPSISHFKLQSMTRFELIFISTPAIGNLVPAVEFANLLTKHDPRFSSTLLIITMPQRPFINTYVQSCASSSSTNNLRFLHLPILDLPTPDQYQSSVGFVSLLIQKHKSHVKHAILNLIPTESHPDSVRLAGLFVDMFSTTIIDVATELGIPSYLFFASPASFLGFALHLPQLATEFLDSETEFLVPSFKNPLPRSVLPNLVLKAKDGYSWILYHAERYRETKGIVINTVQELEPHALEFLSASHIPIPPAYPIGPVLDLDGPARWDPNPTQYDRIMNWLDQQPPSSVVFLCFGSMGSLSGDQVREIAIGLERAKVRFLWALREPPKAQLQDPTDYINPENVLPEGFLKRTAEMGLVRGWVPQVQILAHKAIGGFVSHCGWNSIMESLWYDVPIATWPIYAEQQMNALEIRLDYRDGGDLVYADTVEVAMRRLMNDCDEIRTKVKEMGEKCRRALMENGSSYRSLESLVEKLTTTTPSI